MFEYMFAMLPRTAYLVTNGDEEIPVTVIHDEDIAMGRRRSPVIFFVFDQMNRSPLNAHPVISGIQS